MEANAHARQELSISRFADQSDKLIELVEQLTSDNHNAVRDAVDPVGRTCSEESIGDVKTGGVEIDIPTARTIRSSKRLEIGDLENYRIKLDGVIAHNRTCKFYFADDIENIYSGDIADPVVENFPNIYSESIDSVLDVTAKPILLNGKVTRLNIVDAKRVQD